MGKTAEIKVNVRIPNPISLEAAVRIYYEYIQIGNREIKELFGVSDATALKLKKLAKEQMDAEGILPWDGLQVATKSAYKAWRLDIDDLEKRNNRLKKLAV